MYSYKSILVYSKSLRHWYKVGIRTLLNNGWNQKNDYMKLESNLWFGDCGIGVYFNIC